MSVATYRIVPAAGPAVGPSGPSGSAVGAPADPAGVGRDTSLRRQRKIAHSFLRSITTLKRVRHCGATGTGQEVAVRAAAGPKGLTAGVAGTQTCGSVWACPDCSAKIARHRADELEDAITLWSETGNSFVLLTLTQEHHEGQNLEWLWDQLGRSWKSMLGKRAYKDARRELGVVGHHRTTEATIGENGWHMHFHVLLFVEGTPGPDTVAAASAVVLREWARAVKGQGGRASQLGQDFRQLHGTANALSGVAGYVHKGVYVEKREGVKPPRRAGQLAMEVGRSDLKRARGKVEGGSRAPFEILRDLVRRVLDPEDMTVDMADAALWAEWERVSRGRRQQVWSRGMRDILGLSSERSDEDVAAESFEGETLVNVDATDWRRFTLNGGAEADLLDTIEACTTIPEARAAAARFLMRHGVRYTIPGSAGEGQHCKLGLPDDGPAIARKWRGGTGGR